MLRNFSREHLFKPGHLAKNVPSQVQHGRKRQAVCNLLLKVSKNLEINNPAVLLDFILGH
jgi:hypothetical protein